MKITKENYNLFFSNIIEGYSIKHNYTGDVKNLYERKFYHPILERDKKLLAKGEIEELGIYKTEDGEETFIWLSTEIPAPSIADLQLIQEEENGKQKERIFKNNKIQEVREVYKQAIKGKTFMQTLDLESKVVALERYISNQEDIKLIEALDIGAEILGKPSKFSFLKKHK